MSAYFIDTEFLEGTQEKRVMGIPFGKTKPTIDLISIGVVAEDGREYYAISKDFNLKEAWNRWQQRTGEGDRNNIEPRLYWIRDNVLKPIFDEHYIEVFGTAMPTFNYKSFKYLINKVGKTNKQIAKEIRNFVMCENINKGGQILLGDFYPYDKVNPQFYAYYADYDWVAFCWLFGKMISLPDGFPRYCIDLKQMFDEKADKYVNDNLKEPIVSSDWHSDYCINELKTHPSYPKQTNEHNALADARWNKKLYDFLKTI